jgi:uncharacterized protein (DUF1499 family)
VPAIHDVSTDTINPPAFVDVLAHRRWALNPPQYDGPAAAADQRAAYPDIQPLVVAAPPARVHAAARDVMRAEGWTIVGDAEADGRLEAVVITPWLRFRDDVIVRLTPWTDGRTRVDVRSKSRFGRNDFGTNARRVRHLLARLSAALP